MQVLARAVGCGLAPPFYVCERNIMSIISRLRSLVPFLLCTLLLVTACTSAPSQYDQIQRETSGSRSPAVEKAAVAGGTFNKFFPEGEGNFDVVPAQEKRGFAEYELVRDGTTVAMLAVSDTISLPAAASKYADATEEIAGYPAVNQGSQATGLLVNGRYQVKVLSRDESFTPDDRVAWLQKFDLDGLSKLEGAPVSLVQ